MSDLDGDGYTAPGPGCAPPFDCAGLDPDISPYAFEDADTVHDENCNGRPTVNVYSIRAVSSHPQIADTWAILPTLGATEYQGCASLQNGPGDTSRVPAWTELECDYPWPLLLTGTSDGYVVKELTGPPGAFGTSAPTSYPVGIALSAMWSEVGVPDDSDDGYGSYLVVGTQGQGARRGELSW